MFFVNVNYDFMNEKIMRRAVGSTLDANERADDFDHDNVCLGVQNVSAPWRCLKPPPPLQKVQYQREERERRNNTNDWPLAKLGIRGKKIWWRGTFLERDIW
jgi:hypothetical protein